MRVGFVVNDIKTEEAGYTTTRLGVALTNRGHEAWIISVGDLAYDPDELVRADASKVPKARYKDGIAYMRDLHGKNVIRERVTVDHLDVLFLRNVPSDEKGKREWAKTAALDFGRVAMRHGVIVLNDPNGLAKAENKMYFQLFPEEVRPTTLISRDRKLIREFVNDQGRAVHQTLARFGRGERFSRSVRSTPQPEPDDRRGRPRRLHHRPGVPSEGRKTAIPASS